MISETDIVVIGAGHNSLSAAAYLARAGLSVCVLEEQPQIGGGTVTQELTLPGVLHDTFSSGHVWLLGNPMLRNDDLGLSKRGLRYVGHDPVVVMPFDDGTHLTVWRDPQRTAAEIARFSAVDAQAWTQMHAQWQRLVPTHMRRITAFAGDVGRQVAYEHTDAYEQEYQELAAMSAWDFIHRRFESAKVRSLLGWFAFGTAQRIDQPGSGLLAMAIPVSWSEYGWINAVGGASRLPDALAAVVRESGGSIVTSAKVSRVLTRRGRAVGVVTATGNTYLARKGVVSSVNIARLPELLPEPDLPTSFVEGARNWCPGLSLFVTHLVLKGNHRARADIGTAATTGDVPSSVLLAPSATMEQLQHQLQLASKNLPADRVHYLFAGCHTLIDPSRAPTGVAVVKLITFAPYAIEGDASRWEGWRKRYESMLLNRYAEVARGYVPGEEMAVFSMTPTDIESRNAGYYRGSPQGGEMLPYQSGLSRPVRGWAHYRMPVAGLYHTGVTSHPGAPVSGWPGRHAASAVLEDLGMDADAFFARLASDADPQGFSCDVVSTG